MRTLNAFSFLFLLLDGWIHCRGPKALWVLKDVLRELSKESAADEDLNSSDESLREHVSKIVSDRDVRSSGSQREGEQGKDMGAPMSASGEEEAQPAGSFQLASAPSSTDAMPGVGI